MADTHRSLLDGYMRAVRTTHADVIISGRILGILCRTLVRCDIRDDPDLTLKTAATARTDRPER